MTTTNETCDHKGGEAYHCSTCNPSLRTYGPTQAIGAVVPSRPSYSDLPRRRASDLGGDHSSCDAKEKELRSALASEMGSVKRLREDVDRLCEERDRERKNADRHEADARRLQAEITKATELVWMATQEKDNLQASLLSARNTIIARQLILDRVTAALDVVTKERDALKAGA